MTTVDPLHLYLWGVSESGGAIGVTKKRDIELYAALLQTQSALGQGVVVIEGRKVVFVNDAFCHICGYRADELLDLDALQRMTAPEHRETQMRRYQDRLAGKPVPDHYELTIIHREGRRVELETSAHRYDGGMEPGVIVMVRDITRKKRGQAALRESEMRFRSLADSTPLAIWQTDTEGHIEYCNRVWLDFTGRTLEEERNGVWRDDLHPDDRHAALAAFMTSVHERRAYKIESRSRRKDGEYRWLLTTAKPRYSDSGIFLGLIGTCLDITERKIAELRREQALQENARLLAEVQAAANRQRVFMREILEIVTDGHLRLCDSFAELPQPLPEPDVLYPDGISLRRDSLRLVRDAIARRATDLGFPEVRWKDLVTGVGEAAMNAVMHGGGGTARLYTNHDAGRIQVWIQDNGSGIDMSMLHRATLQAGFSSAGSLGYGFWIMTQTCDAIHLLTGPEGTTIVLEQGIASPIPAWIVRTGLDF